MGGEQIGTDGSLNINKIPYAPPDYYENATKGKICDGDILLCKDGALTGKVCQVDLRLLPHDKVMANNTFMWFAQIIKVFVPFDENGLFSESG